MAKIERRRLFDFFLFNSNNYTIWDSNSCDLYAVRIKTETLQFHYKAHLIYTI
jgi:hypothetical protein